MEIKPGKYLCKNGCQAVVLEVLGDVAFGRVTNTKYLHWVASQWQSNGLNWNQSNSDLDLIAPWEEPKPRLRVWRDDVTGCVKICETKPEPPKSLYVAEDWQPVPELDALFEKGKEE